MIFSEILTRWYSVNKRYLPWRETKDPYKIWLSEIILQQTQVKQGWPYYEAFVAAFPTVFDLAKADESSILKLWQGLGYYSRARNLHTAAKFIVQELQGKFPTSYKGLLNLKGVGDYTASAIASICFNEPTAVVDGNVYRVLSRYFGIDIPINSTEGVKTFKRLAQEVMDTQNPADYNQAIMEFGAIQCTPKNPDCQTCPLNKSCVALHENKIETLPVKLKASKPKKKFFNFLVLISDDGKTFLEKRTGKGIWQNLYQFPLIETEKKPNIKTIEKGVKNHSLLKGREFDIRQYNETPIIHKLSHQHLHTTFYIVSVNTLENGIHTKSIQDYAVPVLIQNFIEAFNFN